MGEMLGDRLESTSRCLNPREGYLGSIRMVSWVLGALGVGWRSSETLSSCYKRPPLLFRSPAGQTASKRRPSW